MVKVDKHSTGKKEKRTTKMKVPFPVQSNVIESGEAKICQNQTGGDITTQLESEEKDK